MPALSYLGRALDKQLVGALQESSRGLAGCSALGAALPVLLAASVVLLMPLGCSASVTGSLGCWSSRFDDTVLKIQTADGHHVY